MTNICYSIKLFSLKAKHSGRKSLAFLLYPLVSWRMSKQRINLTPLYHFPGYTIPQPSNNQPNGFHHQCPLPPPPTYHRRYTVLYVLMCKRCRTCSLPELLLPEIEELVESGRVLNDLQRTRLSRLFRMLWLHPFPFPRQ